MKLKGFVQYKSLGVGKYRSKSLYLTVEHHSPIEVPKKFINCRRSKELKIYV